MATSIRLIEVKYHGGNVEYELDIRHGLSSYDHGPYKTKKEAMDRILTTLKSLTVDPRSTRIDRRYYEENDEGWIEEVTRQ